MQNQLKHKKGEIVLVQAAIEEVNQESSLPYRLYIEGVGEFWVNPELFVENDETAEPTSASVEFSAAPGIRVCARTGEIIIIHFVDGAVLRMIFQDEESAIEFFNTNNYTAAKPTDIFAAYHLTQWWFMP